MKTNNYFSHNTKWFLVLLFTCILVTVSAMGEAATVDREHFVVGGLGLDSTPEYVEGIYGAPDNVEYGRGPFGDITHWY